MFKIYIKDFNKNGKVVTTETLVQEIPAKSEGELKLINPTCKNEMGSSETLDFSIEPGTKFYDAFLQMKTYMRIEYDGDTIFYGRVLTIDNNTFHRTRKIRLEGPLAFLLDSPVEGIEEKKRPKISTYQYLQNLINGHNKYIENEPNKVFMLGYVPGNYGSIGSAQRIKNDTRQFGSDSWTDTKSAIEDLRSHYGGFLRTRAAGKIGDGIYLDWMNHYFNPNKISQTVEVGKNILDLSDITEINNVFTAIIPIGRHSVTTNSSSSSTLNGTGSSKQENLYLDQKVVKVPYILSYYGATDNDHKDLDAGYHRYEDYRDAVKNYGTIIKTVSFQDANTKDKLLKEACEWIKNNYQGGVTKFTIKAIDMHQIGDKKVSKIMIGDRVKIRYPFGKEDGTYEIKETVQTCLSINFDLYHPENNSYTFGIPANMLTKTYGINKTGSVNSGLTSPSKPTPAIGDPAPKNWLDVVGGWLMRHKFYYRGPKPYVDNDENNALMVGDNLYYPIEGLLIKANVNASGHLQGGDLKNFRNDNRVFDEATIEAYKVCEYVKLVYGIDLRTCLDVQAPDITVDSNGNVSFWQNINNAVTNQTEKIKSFLIKWQENLSTHRLDVKTADGNDIYSYMDEDGNWHYYYTDPETGERVETNIRDLDIRSINTDTKVGWIIGDSDDADEAFGQITLGVENYAGGPLVTARMSGELMYLGNYKTQEYTAVSLNHMDQVCGDFEYVTDPVTGLETIKVNSGGGMRVWHAKIDPQTGQPITENGKIKYSEFGIYDENTLTGGMITEHLADGSVVTKIKGDIVDIDATQVKVGVKEGSSVATWLSQQGLSIEDVEGLLANRITAYEGRFSTIEADYLKTTNLRAQVSTVSTGVGFEKFIVTGSDGYISSPAYRLTVGGPDYKEFTLNFGKTSEGGFSHKFLAQRFNPGSGVSNNYLNIGLRAEELTGSNAGKIRISLYNGFTSDGGDGTGAAVFNIAATKKYKDGVAASWNDARTAMVIPTDAVNVGQLSDSAMNNLQIKKPKAYTTYNNSSGDNRYDLFNYKMEPGSFTRPNDSKAVPAIILKSLTSNSTVAALNLSSYLETVEETITTKAKTFTPSEEYVGIGSITVTPTHTAPTATALSPATSISETVSMTADGKTQKIKMFPEYMKPSGSTSKTLAVKLVLGTSTSDTTIGRLAISTTLDDDGSASHDSGTKVKVPVKVTTKINSKTTTIKSDVLTYNMNNLLFAATATSTGNVSLPDGYIGFKSVNVDISTSHQSPWGRSLGASELSNPFTIYADGKTTSFSISKTTVPYYGQNAPCIEVKDGNVVVGRMLL